jgi:hypothetical protein
MYGLSTETENVLKEFSRKNGPFFILVIIYFTRIEYYHITFVQVFLTVEAPYFLSEKGQRIQKMSATCRAK